MCFVSLKPLCTAGKSSIGRGRGEVANPASKAGGDSPDLEALGLPSLRSVSGTLSYNRHCFVPAPSFVFSVRISLCPSWLLRSIASSAKGQEKITLTGFTASHFSWAQLGRGASCVNSAG